MQDMQQLFYLLIQPFLLSSNEQRASPDPLLQDNEQTRRVHLDADLRNRRLQLEER